VPCVQVADDVYKPLRHQYQFQCRGNIRITDRGCELVTYFLLAGDHQLPPLSPGARDHRRPLMTSLMTSPAMTSSVLPCVVQSCTCAPPRGLFRSSSSRDGQGHGQGQTSAVLGRVSMTPPSSLGRHRKQQQVSSGDPWLSGDAPVRRLVAPPSSLTVPVAGEWLPSGGGRLPDLPVVHYCNANIAHAPCGSVDGCVHIRGMSESSLSTCTPTSPPAQQPRRRLSSSGDMSPTTPTVSQPGWSPALRDAGGLQGKALQRIRESPNESGASRRQQQAVADTDGQYDIDAIMRELAVDVERIVASQPPSSSRLVNQSVQTSNVVPPSSSSAQHHHHLALTRAGDRSHLPASSGEHVDPRLRWTTNQQPATTSAGVLQPPLGAVRYTSVHQPSRPINLVQLNGVVSNNFVPNNSRRFVGAAVDPSVRAGLSSNQTETRISPPPLPPPPATERDGHAALQRDGHAASAFKPVCAAANGRSVALQLLTNNVEVQSAVRAHPLAPRPVAELKVEPPPPVRRRGADVSRPTPAVLGPAPSFRVRRSVCVPSLPRLCRSLENIASDIDDCGPRSGTSSRADSPAAPGVAVRQRRAAAGIDSHHQLLLLHPDDVSLSSFDGTASEMSRSDPALSSYGDTSEYDNYRPGMASDEDYFVPEPISDVDIDLFDDVDIDSVEVSDTYAALDSVAIPPPPFHRRVVDDV